jgi:hypothetical protein
MSIDGVHIVILSITCVMKDRERDVFELSDRRACRRGAPADVHRAAIGRDARLSAGGAVARPTGVARALRQNATSGTGGRVLTVLTAIEFLAQLRTA